MQPLLLYIAGTLSVAQEQLFLQAMQEASIETNDLPGHCTAIQTKARLEGHEEDKKSRSSWFNPAFGQNSQNSLRDFTGEIETPI